MSARHLERWNTDDDDNVLQSFPEHLGDEDIYIAVSKGPLHWRIVWHLYEGTNDPQTFNKATCELAGYKVLEVKYVNNRVMYRCSFRGLGGSSKNYKLFHIGRMDSETRAAIPYLVLEDVQIRDTSMACVTCTEESIKHFIINQALKGNIDVTTVIQEAKQYSAIATA